MSGAARPVSKEHRELVAWAAPLGWTWRVLASGHLRWDHPEVTVPVFTCKTPRTRESAKARQKLRTALRRATGRSIE